MNALGQEARALIDSVSKLDEPTPTDKERVRARISAELGAAVFATLAVSAASSGAIATSVAPAAGVGASAALDAGVGSGAAQSTTWSLLGKLALSGAAASLVAGALWLAGSEPAPHAQTKRAAEARVAAPEQTRVEQAPAQVEPELAASEPAPIAEAPAAPAKSKRVAATRKSEEAIEPTPAAAPNTLGAELQMLGEAQAALRAGKPERALALALEHRASYPAGVMKEERDGIEVLAGCALGRDYRAQAEAFVRSAQSSPLRARVQKACGIEP